MSQSYTQRRKAVKAPIRPLLAVAIFLLHLPFLAVLDSCQEELAADLLAPPKVIEVPTTPKEGIPLWESERPTRMFWATHLSTSSERVAGPFQPSPYLKFHRWNGWEVLSSLKSDDLAESDPRVVFRLTLTEMSPRAPRLAPPRRKGSPAPTFPKVILPLGQPNVPEPSSWSLVGVGLFVLAGTRRRRAHGARRH